jgi:lipoprotein-releasing system ATP-binding protein
MNETSRLIVPVPSRRRLGEPQTAHAPDPYADYAQEQTSHQMPQLVVTDLTKSYRKGPIEVPVLRGVDLEVREGEFLAIVGQSGCGKSTLLHLLGTLDAPDRGEIYFDGNRIDNLPAVGRDVLRNRHFGMIFQFYHLLPELTTLENVLSPLLIAHGVISYFRHRAEHHRRAMELLEKVSLDHRLKHKPRELSGGEMQRAAIARALISEPEVLLADEPTGNLDKATGCEIMRILRSLNRENNLTIVMVTHDLPIAEGADRAVRLTEGRVESA